MVVFDKKFKELSENYTKQSDEKLLSFRSEQVQYLFAGMTGSQNNRKRESLIELIDKELERRFKKRTVTISIIALIISLISIIISAIAILK